MNPPTEFEKDKLEAQIENTAALNRLAKAIEEIGDKPITIKSGALFLIADSLANLRSISDSLASLDRAAKANKLGRM